MLLSVEKREFLLDLIDVLKSKGSIDDNISLLGYTGDALVYNDKLMRITSLNEHTYIEVIRHSSNLPVILIQNETVLCFHGEFIYLKEHVDKLLKKLKEEQNEIIE